MARCLDRRLCCPDHSLEASGPHEIGAGYPVHDLAPVHCEPVRVACGVTLGATAIVLVCTVGDVRRSPLSV
jgi:hypothetical protein